MARMPPPPPPRIPPNLLSFHERGMDSRLRGNDRCGRIPRSHRFACSRPLTLREGGVRVIIVLC